MRSGDYNKRFTIQYPAYAGDGMGTPVETWSDLKTVWGKISPKYASQVIHSMQVDMVITHELWIRYRSNFRPEWRLKFGNRFFSIVSIVNPNEGNVNLGLNFKEAV